MVELVAAMDPSLLALVEALSGRFEAALAAARIAACCFENGELDRREEEDLPLTLLLLEPELEAEQLEFEDSERLRPPSDDRCEFENDEDDEEEW